MIKLGSKSGNLGVDFKTPIKDQYRWTYPGLEIINRGHRLLRRLSRGVKEVESRRRTFIHPVITLWTRLQPEWTKVKRNKGVQNRQKYRETKEVYPLILTE